MFMLSLKIVFYCSHIFKKAKERRAAKRLSRENERVKKSVSSSNQYDSRVCD